MVSLYLLVGYQSTLKNLAAVEKLPPVLEGVIPCLAILADFPMHRWRQKTGDQIVFLLPV